MTPKPGREAEAEELNRELVQYYAEQKGCLAAHFVRAAAGSGDIGRVSFWESEELADAAATLHHSMSVRSRLHTLVQRGHQDRSFTSE
jgi:quinol monooxygenase YgiN